MKNIKLLDCTLRDGGRIIDCAFRDEEIKSITTRLTDAKIDIIEVGFLRDSRNVNYCGNSTFFTDVDQIKPFLHKGAAEYVAFVDYGMFDFDTLKPCDGSSINGIRVGFTKKDKVNNCEDLLRCLDIVKNKGYKLYIQGVNTLNYSDREILELVDMINEIHPFSFGIVDTYGAMYIDDIDRIFSLIDNNMNPDICIDFHSHNNYQLSFSLAQEVIHLSKGVRNIIIDATLNGMGKVAGNLNTELMVDFLVRKLKCDYDFDLILDTIDDFIYLYKEKENWGYTIPALFSGIYQAHPNNVRYLTSKFRMQTKDVKNILSLISPDKRQEYDYNNIDRLYMEYNAKKIDDDDIIQKLKEVVAEKEVLVLIPGESLVSNRDKIAKYISENSPFVISVNHVSHMAKWAFWGNIKQYFNASDERDRVMNIVTSNIQAKIQDYVVDYYSLINKKYHYFENSALMLLNLLKRMDVKNISLAGLDGFQINKDNNYISTSFQNERHKGEFEVLNAEIKEMLEEYKENRGDKCKVMFITKSMFSSIFNKEE